VKGVTLSEREWGDCLFFSETDHVFLMEFLFMCN
jgi:hypothetical protein